eukprot:768868-Amphidinium_carterae.1
MHSFGKVAKCSIAVLPLRLLDVSVDVRIIQGRIALYVSVVCPQEHFSARHSALHHTRVRAKHGEE